MGKLQRSLQKTFSRLFSLDKRQRFVVQTVILTVGIITIQLVWEDYRFPLVFFLSALSYGLTAWSLAEDVSGIEWYMLFFLPVLFTGSLSLFYFLLPGRVITRLLITIMFAVCMYAILLIENIYNVAAVRSIQLLRAAQSIGFLLTLVVVFLATNIVYALRLPFWLGVPSITIVSMLLALQSLWSVRLEKTFSSPLLLYSAIVGIGVGKMALALSFWPMENAAYSLLLTVTYYALTGVVQQYFLERLFFNTIREYLVVFLFLLLLSTLITHWG